MIVTNPDVSAPAHAHGAPSAPEPAGVLSPQAGVAVGAVFLGLVAALVLYLFLSH